LTHVGARLIFGQTRYGARSRFLEDLPESAISVSGQSIARPFQWGGSSRPMAMARGAGPAWRRTSHRAEAPAVVDSNEFSFRTLAAKQRPEFDEYSQVPPEPERREQTEHSSE